MAKGVLYMVFHVLIYSSYINLSSSFSVFMGKEAASQVLRIQKRANHFLEEVRPGNMERECREESCSFEEAREIFKSQEKTMEFWFEYKGLNPCKDNPCKNGGLCNVKHYTHSCMCPPKFGGNLCEIEKVECWYKNGGCWQYCQDTAHSLHVICSCTLGYELHEDGKSCTPSVRYPCGLIKRSTRSYRSDEDVAAAAGRHQTNIWNMTELNQTAAHENGTRWNQTLAQTSAGWNWTVQGGTEEEEDMERNFTEVYLPSWLNFSDTDEAVGQRIIGGSFCYLGDCPWQVMIQTKRGYGFCGGSLISSQWVLTAAHCLDTVTPHQVTVGDFDKHQRERNEQKVGVRQYWTHPQYDSNNYNNDIALMRLSSDVVFSQHIIPVCLPSPTLATLLTEEGTLGMVSGWGATHAKGRLTRFLLKVQLPVVSMETCRRSTEKLITDNMFCAGYEEEVQDACKGDSGGPFVVAYRGTWYLMGIVSWGEGCGEAGKYGAFTRVSNYIPWIKEVIDNAPNPAL